MQSRRSSFYRFHILKRKAVVSSSPQQINRRAVLRNTIATSAVVTCLASSRHGHAADRNPISAIRYCMNTSTIRGQQLSLDQEVAIIGEAGYDGIEPWTREIQQYRESGGALETLKRQVEDAGLTVDSAIGFAPWIVDDPQQRKQGIETLKRDMDLIRSIGGTRIAAPPVGATDQTDLDLMRAAERYAKILEIGRQMGVTPQLEIWGFSKSLSRLGEVLFVASESGDADACLLPDVYHIYKGGSDFQGLSLVNGASIHVMHLNDYPADPPQETIRDQHRVYPGDGVAPLSKIIHQLITNGFRGTFSLELFNPVYWEQPARDVAVTGLAKMKMAVQASVNATGW